MNIKTELCSLREHFRRYAVAPETLFLLNPENAVDLIERATSKGAKLAGVEGFVITSAGAYEPRQDFSNDVADWQGSKLEFVETTKELIERGAKTGIRFQVVFEDE